MMYNHQNGIKNAVAALGTAFTKFHINKLLRYSKNIVESKLLDGKNVKDQRIIEAKNDKKEIQMVKYEISKIDMQHINTIDNSLLEAASLLEKSCLYIGSDSGLGHIASAVKTPTISFFSLMKPDRYRPWGDKAICICGSDNDVRNISVDEVSAVVLSARKGA